MAEDNRQKVDDHLAPTERPAMPKPEKLIDQGITTRETLDHHERQPLPSPARNHTPDGETWEQVKQRVANERRCEVTERRQNFENRFHKARSDFRTAHDYGRKGHGPER